MPKSVSLLPAPTGSLRISDVASTTIRLSLVVPTYNEAKNVETLITRLTQLLDRSLPQQYELILVDDDSPDLTWKIAHEIAQTFPQVHVVRRQGERGLSTAVIRGWQVASGEVFGVIDGDLQHPPEVLLNLLREIDRGADLAVASRHVNEGGVSNWNVVRRCLSRGAQVLGLVLLPQVVGRVSDPMSGYFLVRRSAIADCFLSPTGYKILLEVIGRGEIHRIAEVGYVFQERQSGDSKVTWKQYIEYILHLARLRSRGRIERFRQRFPTERLLQFCAVGASGVVVDMVLLYLLSDPAMLGWALTRSKIIAAEAAVQDRPLQF